MNATARKLILTALAVLATGVAMADEYTVFSGRTIGPVAELSAEERAWFRDRWQRLPSGERENLRRKLLQEWADLPPEERQRRRQELMNKLEERQEQRWERGIERSMPETGYGQGYGTRPWDNGMNDVRHRGRR